MRRHFEGGGISRCGEISRKYGMCNNNKDGESVSASLRLLLELVHYICGDITSILLQYDGGKTTADFVKIRAH